jgi:hypothetical protein
MTRLHLLALAAFASTALWLGWDPVEAGETKTAAPVKGAKKGARKSDAAAATGPAKSLTGGQKIEASALARIIDQQIAKNMQAEGVKASPRSEDSEFLRRVYLDLVGMVPSAEKVQAFLDSKDANKRAAVIDELLADPRFGKQQAEIWSGLLIPHDSNNRRLSEKPFVAWLAEHFNANQPLNQLVHDLVAAAGSQDENGAVTFFIANPTVDKMTDNVTRMFLGVQLQCAQCHNHPFTDYKQTEYWSVAAFFMKTRLTANPNQAAKKGVSPGIFESNKTGKKQMLPESAKKVPAQFLRGEQPKLDEAEPYRPILAKWISSPDNPFFARAMVNRFWYQLFGRGLVSPVDDMHADNNPAHPELLATLTEQFKLNNFDLKYLVRALCNSEAYQRSSKSDSEGTVDPDLYAQRLVRTMTPEQLYDSLATVLQSSEGRGGDRNKAVKKGPPAGPRDNFLAFFRVEDPNPLDYQSGIPQALRLMNSAMANNLNAAVKTASSAGTPEQVVQRLYLTALARRPSPEETRRMTEYAARQGNATNAYSDILWALVNSSEFVLNH